MRETRLSFIYALSWIIVGVWALKIDRHSLQDVSYALSTAFVFALFMPFITALPALITGQRIDMNSLSNNDFNIRAPLIYSLNQHSETVRIFSKGNSLLPILLIYGNFNRLSEEEKLTVMAHESLHIRFWHTPICIFLFAAISITLRDPLFAMAVSSSLSRYFEYRADHFASSITSPETVVSALHNIKPGKDLEKLIFIPVVNLLLSHPPASLRMKRLEHIKFLPAKIIPTTPDYKNRVNREK